MIPVSLTLSAYPCQLIPVPVHQLTGLTPAMTTSHKTNFTAGLTLALPLLTIPDNYYVQCRCHLFTFSLIFLILVGIFQISLVLCGGFCLPEGQYVFLKEFCPHYPY